MDLAHETIEERAYDLFLERNGNDGSELEDWLKAEKAVTKENAERTEIKSVLEKNHKHGGKVPVGAGK
jgi:hypothetical protein